MDLIPLIISGSGGERLWPVSRTSNPKQFCDFLDKSLFQIAVERLRDFGPPWTITTKACIAHRKKLRKTRCRPSRFSLNHFAKNTAAAFAFLCRKFQLAGGDPKLLSVFFRRSSSDDVASFHRAIRLGAEIAARGEVVTLSLQPTFPATELRVYRDQRT